MYSPGGVFNSSEVHAQRFDERGHKLGKPSKPIKVSESSRPGSVDMTPSGEFVVVWTAFGDGRDVFGQRFDASGNPMGGQFLVNEGYTAGDQWRANVEMADSGSFVVSWNSDHDPTARISARAYAADGTSPGVITPRTDNLGGSDYSDLAAMDVAPDGSSFVVGWRELTRQLNDRDGDGEIDESVTDTKIFAQQYGFGSTAAFADAQLIAEDQQRAWRDAGDEEIFFEGAQLSVREVQAMPGTADFLVSYTRNPDYNGRLPHSQTRWAKIMPTAATLTLSDPSTTSLFSNVALTSEDEATDDELVAPLT